MLTAKEIATRLKEIMDSGLHGGQATHLKELREEITIEQGNLAHPHLGAIVETLEWVVMAERAAREEFWHNVRRKTWWLPLLISLGSLAAVILLKN